MRALKTLFKVTLLLVLLVGFTGGVLIPLTWMYVASNLPNTLESELDVETHLRQSIESERQSVQISRPVRERESVKWDRPDFSRLPKHLIAFYITGTGCPRYFQSPREEGWPWTKRVLWSTVGVQLPGNGGCELIFAELLAMELGAKTTLQLAVAADRVHRFLKKDQLVAYRLHTMRFERGVIGVEKAAEVISGKPLTELTLSELAELQLAIPPHGYWDDIKLCRNAAQIKEARDAVLNELASVSHISEEMAKTAIAQPVRCLAVKR